MKRNLCLGGFHFFEPLFAGCCVVFQCHAHPKVVDKINSIMATSTTETYSPTKTPNQTCDHFFNYLTAKDWTFLAGPAGGMAKINCMVSRCLSIALRNPTERTVAVVVATLMVGNQDVRMPWLNLPAERCNPCGRLAWCGSGCSSSAWSGSQTWRTRPSKEEKLGSPVM